MFCNDLDNILLTTWEQLKKKNEHMIFHSFLIVRTNLSANSCLFTHPRDMEKYEISFWDLWLPGEGSCPPKVLLHVLWKIICLFPGAFSLIQPLTVADKQRCEILDSEPKQSICLM